VKIFVWILEMPIVGQMVLYILKKDNLINKVKFMHQRPYSSENSISFSIENDFLSIKKNQNLF
jgi:hypothetical protein